MENTIPYEDPKNVNKSNSSTLWILLIFSLLGNTYLAYEFYNSNFKNGKSVKTQNAELLADIQKINFSKDSLQSEFDAIYKQFQEAATQSNTLNEEKASIVAELEKRKIQVARLLAQGGGPQLLKAKAEIEALKKELTDYQAKVESLRSENDAYAGKNAELEAAKGEAQSKAQMAEEEKTAMKQKISKSSYFMVSDLKIAPQRSKRGEKETTFKTSKVENIRVTFELIPTDIIEKGDKSISIRILGANGEVLTNDNEVLQDSDQLITHKYDFVYNGDNESVSYNYKQTATFKKGAHMVEIIQDGKLLSRGNFTLE